MTTPETLDEFDDVFPISDDWNMNVGTNEPQQVDEVFAEPTVEDSNVTTEPGHLERMAQLRRGRDATRPAGYKWAYSSCS